VLLRAAGAPHTLEAQAIWDRHVGETPSTLSKLGPVSGIEKYKGNDVFRWVLPNRNQLMATVDPEGEIVFLESDWGGKNNETGCDLAGLKFEETTLADLQKRFGSNGLRFKQRPRRRNTDDGVMLLNSWETGDVVVTFYTHISAADYARAQAAGAADASAANAKLEGISLANASFARSEWGDRVYDRVYKKIEWK
jgi:hypothetical protein